MKTIQLAGRILAIVLASAPALSHADESAPRTITVHSQDLDLTTVAGRGIFKARVRAAARDVCGREEVIAMQNAGAVSSCYEATLFQAMTQANTRIAAAEQRGAVSLAAK